MNETDKLFFELVRVSIGTADHLSRIPGEKEWSKFFGLSIKQSLCGICFAGLQNLGADTGGGCVGIGLPRQQFLAWMGKAVAIQRRNELVNRRCLELQESLSSDGQCICILKGQGIAQLYGEQLSLLRQPGDIDVWVQNRDILELVGYCSKLGLECKATAAHVECKLFPDTEVELHALPAFLRCPWNQRKLERWFNSPDWKITLNGMGMRVPAVESDLVYMMVHMYHHILMEGLGLRQLMDYFFVLKAIAASPTKEDSIKASYDELSRLGMGRFSSGIMWVMREIFDLPDELMLCEADEKTGSLLLDEILTGGNFGRFNKNNKGLHSGPAIGRILNRLKRNMRFLTLGPWEVLCSPFWSLWHWFWRKRYGLI